MSFGWPEVPIRDVAEPADRSERVMPGVRYRQIGVRLWGEGAYEREPIDGIDTKYKTLNRTQAGDIIVNKIWARNGSVSVVVEGLEDCYCSGEFPLFHAHEYALDPRWFLWITKTRWFWGRCDAEARGTSGKNRIRPERFLAIRIPLPPLEEQRRIVAKIERLVARMEEGQRLRREALRANGALLASASCQLIDELGWPELSVEDACEALIDYRGRTPPTSSSGIPHITSANVKDGEIDWRTARFVSEETYQRYMTRGTPRRGDVIFTMEAPLGEAATLPDDRRFSLAQRTLLLRGRPELVDGRYLARALMSPGVRESISAQSTGTTVKGIAAKRLRKIRIPVPSLREQVRIVDRLTVLQRRQADVGRIQHAVELEFDALLPSILDKAFRGVL